MASIPQKTRMRQPDFGSQTASPPFVGCTVLSGGGWCNILGAGPRSRRSLEDLLLDQLELHPQPRPLRCGRRSRPKEFARGPPDMAIKDGPFKRAVRAGMPPHVEQSLFHRAPRHAVDPAPGCGQGSFFLFACQLLAKPSIVFSRFASDPCHGWRRSPQKGRRSTKTTACYGHVGFVHQFA
jgi:hypothetical protein